MASRRDATFFVESYVPKLDDATATAMLSRLRTAVDELRREGHRLRLLRSFVLVDEETYVWMVAARDIEEVALLNRRAAVPCDHVVEVVGVEGGR